MSLDEFKKQHKCAIYPTVVSVNRELYTFVPILRNSKTYLIHATLPISCASELKQQLLLLEKIVIDIQEEMDLDAVLQTDFDVLELGIIGDVDMTSLGCLYCPCTEGCKDFKI